MILKIKNQRYTASYSYDVVKGMKEEEFSKKFPKDSKNMFKKLQLEIKKYEDSLKAKKEVSKPQIVAEKPKFKG